MVIEGTWKEEEKEGRKGLVNEGTQTLLLGRGRQCGRRRTCVCILCLWHGGRPMVKEEKDRRTGKGKEEGTRLWPGME